MDNDVFSTDLGAVTAYADAKAHGYTGTRDEFGVLLAGAGKNLEDAVDAKDAAANSATAASDSAGAAAKSATAAGNSASTALGSATAASGSATAAGKSAEGAAGSATAAKRSADTAAGSAKAAQNSAAAAAASAEEIKNAGFAVYGVDFTGSTSAGTRTGAAAEFVFTPGTDTSAGQFLSTPPSRVAT